MTDQISSQTRPENTTLKITRILDASCETVFDYFTLPENLSIWFAPDPSMKTIVHKLDLEIGGEYEIEMASSAEGKSHVVAGKYLEIDKPSRLVYTWYWKSEPGSEVSQVTVELEPSGKGTQLNLSHDRFETSESRDKHNQGWAGCLDRLEKAV